MEYSTPLDILFLLAAVYFWPGVPGQEGHQYQQAARQSVSSASTGASSSPSTPLPVSPALHSLKNSSDTLSVPRIVLHGNTDSEHQAPAPIFKRHGHKRKSVSFSLSSMAELSTGPGSGTGSDLKIPAPSPNMQHRPPTPFHRAPPTPSEIFALAEASPLPMPSKPVGLTVNAEHDCMAGKKGVSFQDVPTPLTADMVMSQEKSDPMGVQKGWLV